MSTGTQARPLAVGEVLEAAFRLYREHFGTLVRIVTVVVAPVVILSTVITAATTENAFDLTADEVVYTDEGAYLAGQGVAGALNLVAALLAVAVAFRVLSAGYRGERETGGESLRFGLNRILPVLWISLLVTVAAVLGLFLLIVGAIWLLVAFSVAIPVLMVEDRRGTKALGRSFGLVRGRWWATFGAFLVAYLVLAVASLLIGALLAGALFAGLENQLAGAIVNVISSLLSMVIATPLIAAVSTVIYFDLRLRKEGAPGAGAAPPPGTGAQQPATGGLGPAPEDPRADEAPGPGGFLPPRAPGGPG